jgi:uncharacterized protein YjbI with pentapeptide repeats
MRHAESRGDKVNIEIKRWDNEVVLWSGEAVDIADGVQKAVEAGVSLAYASLAGADLAGVDLAGADLAGADLVGAILVGANLARSNLAGVDLADANLAGSTLAGANLAGANLAGTNLSYARINEPICRMDFGGWSICIRSTETTIGCCKRANDSWLQWIPESEVIKAMHKDAPAWWATHGAVIKEAIRCVMRKEHEVAR